MSYRRLRELRTDLGAQVKSSVKSRVGCILALLYLSLDPSSLHTAAKKNTYFDCSQIQHLKTYKLQDVCKPLSVTQPNNATKRYQLLQKGSLHKMYGHSCHVISTKFTDFFNLYFHCTEFSAYH